MLHVCPSCPNSDVEKPVERTDDGRATAECPDCRETFQFPYRPLYTLEGAPAVGKSTTAGRLDGEIDLAVYEGDLHIDLTNGNLSWASICDLDLRVCMTLHHAGRQALFVGGVHPHDLAESPETRYFPRVERCALVCDDADLEARLRERPETTDETVETFLGVNRWYRERESAEGITVVNTTAADPNEVAAEVDTWIESSAE
jgi:hypothetical protein